MKTTNPYRDEWIAVLMAEYRRELESLSDAELQVHVDAVKHFQNMTDKEWAHLLRKHK